VAAFYSFAIDALSCKKTLLCGVLSETEDDLADLVENIRSSTQNIDEMCSNAVASVRATSGHRS
jgi:hypothetical protein